MNSNYIDSNRRKQGLHIEECDDCLEYINYLDNKKHGNWKSFYKENLKRDRNWLDGELNGFYRIYLEYKPFSLCNERFFLNHKSEGEEIAYE